MSNYDYFINPSYFVYDRTSSRSEVQQMIDELFFTRCEIRDYHFSGRNNPAEYRLYRHREAYLDRILKMTYGLHIPFDY